MAERTLRVRRLVAGAEVIEHAELVLDGEWIVEIRPDRRGPGQHDGWLVPGFVDTHCHGAAGADFSDADGVATILEHHRDHGTTAMIGSLVSAPVADLATRLRSLPRDVPGLIGWHLEGPFLSVARCGAHDPEVLTDPDPASVRTLIEAGGGALRMITLAPELSGAMGAIDAFTAAGVQVAFGHSDADATTTREAVRRGAVVATHLFNAMRPIHHRDPGPVPVLLTESDVTAELIADGHHLDDDVIKLAVDAAGPERIALITDAMAATGLADGAYPLGSMTAEVAGGLARIRNADGSLGSIAGSTLTMDAAFERLVGLGYPIPDVAVMAATTPARTHRVDNAGVLAPGQPADAVLVDDEGRRQGVLWRGRWRESPAA
ncbi:N-acetylglucosamine-6-phosphate deacetylase [Naumannella huperziae]